ncbi:MAG TPA: RES family NAD+ phosphorylase [Oculatellaceae cyanobacterium]
MHPEAVLPDIIAGLPLREYTGLLHRLVDFATLTRYDPMMPLFTLGPGMNGQRYTPKGGPSALYAAEDVVTAHAEYHRLDRIVLVADQTFHLVANPTVALTIQVNLERVLDIADPAIQTALGTTATELTGPWRKQMIKKVFCPTQVLARAVYANGTIQGMRYPSARGVEFSNLIMWDERIAPPSFIEVRDTTGTLSARIPPKRRTRNARLGN